MGFICVTAIQKTVNWSGKRLKRNSIRTQCQGGDKMSLTVRTEQNGRNGLGMAADTVGVKQRGENGKSVFAGTLIVPSQTDSLVEQKRQSAKLTKSGVCGMIRCLKLRSRKALLVM